MEEKNRKKHLFTVFSDNDNIGLETNEDNLKEFGKNVMEINDFEPTPLLVALNILERLMPGMLIDNIEELQIDAGDALGEHLQMFTVTFLELMRLRKNKTDLAGECLEAIDILMKTIALLAAEAVSQGAPDAATAKYILNGITTNLTDMLPNIKVYTDEDGGDPERMKPAPRKSPKNSGKLPS